MEILVYFILGAVFIQWIIPILDSFTSLILTLIEYCKAKVSVPIAKYNAKIQENTNPYKDIEDKHIAGFVVSEEDENTNEKTL